MYVGQSGGVSSCGGPVFKWGRGTEWFIEIQAFSPSYDLAPPPPFLPSSPVSKLDRRHTGRLRKTYNFLTWDGGGGSLIIRRRESLVLYKSFSALWDEAYSYQQPLSSVPQRTDDQKEKKVRLTLAKWLEILTVDAKNLNSLGSSKASADTVDSAGRQIKQNTKNPPV
jgi:hypothetical protein